tara:strand:- start:348 stop:947 length:600 start_codon:yes stop_codon:yes gene_type:complete
MNIEHETVARWFNYVRENTLNIKRFTECFWDTQLKSKAEIIDNLPQDLHGNYYVFGGWYGVLAHLLNDNIVADEIYSVDIDEKCKEIGDIYFRNANLTYVTADMKDFEYPKKPDVVINTSTEHVHQHSYGFWWNNIPSGTFYVVQGNDLDIPEHVRSFKTLPYFLEWNLCTNTVYESAIELPGPNNSTYTRFTAMGYKE